MSDDLIAQLVAAGVADAATTRVVVDLRVGEMAVVYCEKIGTRSLIEVMAAMSRVVVKGSGAHRTPDQHEDDESARAQEEGTT